MSNSDKTGEAVAGCIWGLWLLLLIACSSAVAVIATYRYVAGAP